MIPHVEIERFHELRREAVRLGFAGHVQEGYAVLDLGLCWAEAPVINPWTGEISAPDPWAESLAEHYRRALVVYGERFGVCFPGAGRPAQIEPRETGALVREAGGLRLQALRLRERACEARFRSRQLCEASAVLLSR
jgi:hypothetical protein